MSKQKLNEEIWKLKKGAIGRGDKKLRSQSNRKKDFALQIGI